MKRQFILTMLVPMTLTLSAFAQNKGIEACRTEIYRSYKTNFYTSLVTYEDAIDWVCNEYKSKEAAIIFNDCISEKVEKRRAELTSVRGANELETLQNLEHAKAMFALDTDMCAGYTVAKELKK